jgi:transposase-like protein
MNLEYTRNKKFPVIDDENPRVIRAKAMVKKDFTPVEIKENEYEVPSESSNKTYKVFKLGEFWFCNCPDSKYRKLYCKHIFAVELWVNNEEKKHQHKTLDTSGDGTTCKYCKSTWVIKNGTRKTQIGVKNRYLCKECNRTFVIDESQAFSKMKFNAKTVTLCLDLYFKGSSLRKIQEHLKDFHETDVNFSTISRWIKKFSALINEYVKTLKPNVGGTWQADEMMIKNEGDWSWLWNVMDKDTRFLLSTLVTERRSMKEARKVFRLAKEQAVGRPNMMITDGLWSYKPAFKKEFYARRGRMPQLVQHAGPSKAVHNNKVERLNGTVREREKVMRGMKDKETAQELIDGFRNYYNFIRPHQALNGKTPAEMAGLSLNLGDNKWLGLIEKASETI